MMREQIHTNYRRLMDDKIKELQKQNERKKLLLHACCAPCSTSCLEILRKYFDVTVLFYNPNITEENEYHKRLEEEIRLIGIFNDNLLKRTITSSSDDEDLLNKDIESKEVPSLIGIMEAKYDPLNFLSRVKGYENEKEGGERCKICFDLRLREAAELARRNSFDFFTTTLTISPMKNAHLLNGIGIEAGEEAGVAFLPSDFKKKNGYLRSVELSGEFDLYRQDYCGCVFSKAERSCYKCRKQNEESACEMAG